MKKIIIVILALTVFAKSEVFDIAQAEAIKHTYTPTFYDCKHFSRDVRQTLIDKFRGLEVLYRITIVDCSYFDCSHDKLHKFLWIPKAYNNTEQYYIEAETGQEITKDLYNAYGLQA